MVETLEEVMKEMGVGEKARKQCRDTNFLEGTVVCDEDKARIIIGSVPQPAVRLAEVIDGLNAILKRAQIGVETPEQLRESSNRLSLL